LIETLRSTNDTVIFVIECTSKSNFYLPGYQIWIQCIYFTKN